LRWNLILRPRVQGLRQRILLHNSKIQLALQPFQMDVNLRIYHALAQDIRTLRDETRNGLDAILRNLQVLMQAFAVQLPERTEEDHLHRLEIPPQIKMELETLFWSHPDQTEAGDFVPALWDIADAFVRCFETATNHSPLDPKAGGLDGESVEGQYLNLLACQFLMSKMLGSDEYLNTSDSSHWPSYIKGLAKMLSDECIRFTRDTDLPNISHRTPWPRIWPKEEHPEDTEFVEDPRPMELLLDLDLMTTNRRLWRKMVLFRLLETEDSVFCLVITTGQVGQPASRTIPVDIDLSVATLVPQYAVPGASQSLVMILNNGRGQIHPLEFHTEEDLFLFQQALTGYQVFSKYMPK